MEKFQISIAQFHPSNMMLLFILQLKIVDLTSIVVLTELLDSIDEKETRGKPRGTIFAK